MRRANWVWVKIRLRAGPFPVWNSVHYFADAIFEIPNTIAPIKLWENELGLMLVILRTVLSSTFFFATHQVRPALKMARMEAMSIHEEDDRLTLGRRRVSCTHIPSVYRTVRCRSHWARFHSAIIAIPWLGAKGGIVFGWTKMDIRFE